VRARSLGRVGGTHRPLNGPARLAGSIPVLGDRARPVVVSDRERLKQLGRPTVESGPALRRERRVGRAPHQGMRESDTSAR